MFSSFLQAGFECSTHKLRDGRRLDLIAGTRHDEFARLDYQRLKERGIRTAREGLRWHLISKVPGVWDFSSCLPLMEAAQETGIQVIWDLFHFGWPDYLDIFEPAWRDALADFAFEFACLWKKTTNSRAFLAPLNEISFFSWAGGEEGFFDPFVRGRGGELKTQLVRAALQSIAAIRSELPDAVIVSPDPVIHIHGNPAVPGDAEQAERYRLSMFEAWDMLLGVARPELGGHRGAVDVLGINYYDRNQWWNFGPVIRPGDAAYRPFHLILQEVYERYRIPLLITETGTEDEERPAWFAYIAAAVREALRCGVPVQGICWYPILNHPGWTDDRHCHNGLWDYADDRGFRALYEPLAMELKLQEEIRAQTGTPEKQHLRLK